MIEFSNKIRHYGMVARPNRDKIIINLDKIIKDNLPAIKVIAILIHEQKHISLNPLIFSEKLKNFVDSLNENQKDCLDTIRHNTNKETLELAFEELIVNELTRQELGLSKEEFKEKIGSDVAQFDNMLIGSKIKEFLGVLKNENM